MRKINTYIIEKLHINKDTKVKPRNIIEKITSIIYKFLEEKEYYYADKKSYDVQAYSTKNYTSIIFKIPQIDVFNNTKLREYLGQTLCEKINKEASVDYYWSLDSEDRHWIIEFSDRIVL